MYKKLFTGERVEFYVTKLKGGKKLGASHITGPSNKTVQGKILPFFTFMKQEKDPIFIIYFIFFLFLELLSSIKNGILFEKKVRHYSIFIYGKEKYFKPLRMQTLISLLIIIEEILFHIAMYTSLFSV